MSRSKDKDIEVWADWQGLGEARPMGHLRTTVVRGKEIFSFEYERNWLESAPSIVLDPAMRLHQGPQYAPSGRENFGVFLDSSPDRWGRMLMERRAAHLARQAGETPERLLPSDYLLGVHDGHWMGALRFRMGGPFLDDREEMAAPPLTSLRELEHAARQLERDDAELDDQYGTWLRLLIAPGGSLGGARPKASVQDEAQHLWIAKFPSGRDVVDSGAWEAVVHELARRAGVEVPEARLLRLASTHATFLSRRFDRADGGQRMHMASAMTLLERSDGDGAAEGASYLEMADLLVRVGARTAPDLEQLWRRVVFSICVSNTDDHLRNHAFLLREGGWVLAPAYDMNPDPYGEGLRLNVDEADNAQDLDLALSTARYYRIKPERAKAIVAEVVGAVQGWREVAGRHGLSSSEQERMRRAFRLVGVP